MQFLTARADVLTTDPDRYAKQLVSHLGRRVDFATEGAISSARFGEGTDWSRIGSDKSAGSMSEK